MKFFLLLLCAVVLSWGFVPLHAAELNHASTLVDTGGPATSPAPETRFDPVIDDLPLMEGLSPVPEEATLFVAPHAGRIAESMTEGLVDVDEVYMFYRRTLPHLGWQRLDNRTYHRHGEKLRIDAHADGKVTKVRFSIKPE